MLTTAHVVHLVVPGPSAPFKERNPFVEQLITLIFAKQNITAELSYAPDNITQGRALKSLSDDDIINLTWSVTTAEREALLLPIRIPLYQGFMGWRVFIIDKNNQQAFSHITSISDLSGKVAVQRFDWPDYQILLENNLPVEGNLPFTQMFKAIESGLVDYFPRSILEVTRELASVESEVLAIEQSLLLKYPSWCYFFVGKNNPELAKQIAKGFKLALADGSYQLLFQQHFGQAIAALHIEKRKVLHLQNSLQPTEKPLVNDAQ